MKGIIFQLLIDSKSEWGYEDLNVPYFWYLLSGCYSYKLF